MTRSKNKRATAEPSTDEDSNTKEETLKSTSAPLTSCASVCIALAIGGVVMQWWWPLPILLFIGLMSQGYEERLPQKPTLGIPGSKWAMRWDCICWGPSYLFSAVCCSGAPSTFRRKGGTKIFSGPGAEAAQGVIEADGDA